MADSLIDLAILVLVIDKHRDNALKLVRHAHEYYPMFPILVLDNTVKGDLVLPDYCKVYKNTSKNKTTAYSRKVLVSYCTNEYVWFVDADDDIIKTNEIYKFDNKYDIYNFSYLHVKKESDDGIVSQSELPLWTHFIKTSILKEVQKYITEEDYIIYNEDVLLTTYAYAVTDKLCVRKDVILYKSNAFASNSMTDDYSDVNLKKFAHALRGRKTYLDIINNRIKEVKLDYDDTNYYIFRMFSTEGLYNKEIMLEYLFESGIEDLDLYKKAFDIMSHQLTAYAYRESVFLLNTLFGDVIKVAPSKVLREEKKKIIDEFGKEIVLQTRSWFEYVDFEYGELHL